MEPRLKELHESRNKAVVELKRLQEVTKDREFTADETAAWNKADAELNRLDAAIKREGRISELAAGQRELHDVDEQERRHNRDAGSGGTQVLTNTDFMLALRGRLIAGAGREPSTQQREAMRRCNFPTGSEYELALLDSRGLAALRRQRLDMARSGSDGVRAASLTLTSGAGFIPPGEIAAVFEQALLEYGPVREVAET
jgi:HK97 family phage major capsid protein